MMDEQEKTIEEYKKEAEEYLNGWKRSKADFVNYQKQVEHERAEWAMFSSASCVRVMLPVLDSLEGAALQHRRHSEESRDEESALPAGRSHAVKQGTGSFTVVQDDIGVAHGIVKIRDQMIDVLRSIGVEVVKTVGEPVNPEFHEAIGVETSEEHASGLIIKEVQRGYTMHGKVLRVAKVIVSE